MDKEDILLDSIILMCFQQGCEFDEYFCFTDTEVQYMLHYKSQERIYDTVQEWYDSYRFRKVDIYYPWDVVCYCRTHKSNKNLPPKILIRYQ